VPYNPKKNGVVERKNRRICEAMKAMMFDQDLPNYLWAEATSTVMYIKNRCPHAKLKEKTPEEVFLGIKPEVGNLRIFGCPVYIHVPKENRTKMEPSGKKGVFVGYSEISKDYNIYVWDIVPRPKDKSVVSSKWIYKIKHAADGSVENFKERFLARGFTQKEGINYEETFSPVARYTSIQTIISLTSVLGWKLH
jgi:hypothetical protein